MIEDIQRRIEFMRSLDREHVHLPIETVEQLMATAIGKVDKKALEKGKVKPVDKRPTHRKIADKAKVDRKAEAWTTASTPTATRGTAAAAKTKPAKSRRAAK